MQPETIQERISKFHESEDSEKCPIKDLQDMWRDVAPFDLIVLFQDHFPGIHVETDSDNITGRIMNTSCSNWIEVFDDRTTTRVEIYIDGEKVN